METGSLTTSRKYTSAAVYNIKTASDSAAAETSTEKKTDTFEKTVDDILSEKGYKNHQEQLRRRRQEIQREQQQIYELRAERRRKLKLLLKKHDDYVRFLEGTALKRSLAERKRIEDPKCSAAEINSVSQSPPDAKMPLFIRVK
ncbi:MAG: hypothetical protein J1E40_05175 [Oscillospiraceae bacterium]|nr:hypothetical protein [Oscillospiraceae bacterium]